MTLFFCSVMISVILQRLAELQVAKRNTAYIRSLGGFEVGANHYPWIVSMHALFLFCLLLEVFVSNRPLASWWWIPFTLFLLAQCMRFWCLRSLGRFWNTRIYILPGAPLVHRGPYRYLRHPNYWVVGVELLTLPLTFSAYATALAFTVCNLWFLLRIRIPLEEKTLEEHRAGGIAMNSEKKQRHAANTQQERSSEGAEAALPDFKQLNDRIIAPAPTGPFLRIRTNLDEEQPAEEQ